MEKGSLKSINQFCVPYFQWSTYSSTLWFYLWAIGNILLVPSLINELNNTYIYIYIYFYESWFYLSKNWSFNSSKTQWVRIWKFVCGFYPVLRQSSFHYPQLTSSLLLFLNVNANVIFVIHLEKDLTIVHMVKLTKTKSPAGDYFHSH